MDCIVLRWRIRHISIHLMMAVRMLRWIVISWRAGRQWLNAGALLLTVGL